MYRIDVINMNVFVRLAINGAIKYSFASFTLNLRFLVNFIDD